MRFTQLMKPLSRVFQTPPIPPNGSPNGAPNGAPSGESPPPQSAAEALDAVRTAAILAMPDGDALRALAGLTAGAAPSAPAQLPAQQRIAQQRIAQLIDAAELEFAQLCNGAAPAAALLSIASMCRDAECLRRALAGIDAAQRAGCAVQGSTSRLRRMAAESIEDPAVLAQLLTQTRGKDKNVHKIVKQKCDALRMQAQQGAQQAADAEAAAASLERHGHRAYEPIYTATFEHFLDRWRNADAHATPQLKLRAQQAIDRCREIIAEQARKVARLAAAEVQAAERSAARELASMQEAAAAQQRAALDALAAAEAQSRRQAEEQQRLALEATQAAQTAAAALAASQLKGLIGKALGALRDGNTGRAAGLRQAIEAKRAAMTEQPASEVPAHLARQIAVIDTKLEELKAWKDYAVAPKRAELIADMQALIGSSEAAPMLAERVKRLQDEWKTVSRGLSSDSDADWQLFHQAAESAYQPCRVYFEAQAKERRANLDKRRAVLDRLLAFETAQNGEAPDWRGVAVVLREAPLEWRRASPVERRAVAEIQDAFDASVRRLQARLDAWHGDNAAHKQALVTRAQRLSELDGGAGAGNEAAEGAKRLQAQWQDLGPANREQEQKLWHEFRAHCDAVFQKRQQAQVQHAAALETAKRGALALCERAESAAATTGSALREALANLAQWRASFDALGELPRADQRRLRDRFERALSGCRGQAALQQTRDQERAYADLLEAGRLIQAYGWGVSQNAAAAACDALQQSAETHIASVAQWPKGSPAALAAAWAAARTRPDPALHETALRTLCVRAEIGSETQTPAEDAQRRRDIQMQRLVQGMAGGGAPVPADWASLAMEWMKVGPVAPDLQTALLARFMRCRRS